MNNLKNSTDVWFCAYLQLKGYKIVRYETIIRGKVRLYFDVSDTDWQNYKLDFSNSDFSTLKHLIDKIKDLAF